MSEAPGARLVREASAPFEVAAADGRRLTLRRMTVLDRLRLFKAVGAELATNEAYLGIAYFVCAVTAIDDVPVPPPVNEAQIEALAARLGDSGIAAIAAAFESLPEAPEIPPGN